MSFITRNLKQVATVWTASGSDLYGNPTYAAPVKIKVRWEERTERTLDSTGNDILSQAFVFMSQKYDTGTYLYLGVSTDATPPNGAFPIRNFQSIPNLRGTFSEHKATL